MAEVETQPEPAPKRRTLRRSARQVVTVGKVPMDAEDARMAVAVMRSYALPYAELQRQLTRQAYALLYGDGADADTFDGHAPAPELPELPELPNTPRGGRRR